MGSDVTLGPIVKASNCRFRYGSGPISYEALRPSPQVRDCMFTRGSIAI